MYTPGQKPSVSDMIFRIRREIRQDLGWDTSIMILSRHPNS
jgi:hypothetical protein